MEKRGKTARRRWWFAGLFSYLVPGLGQVYNGQAEKGLLYNFVFTTWDGFVLLCAVQALKRQVSAGSVAIFFALFLFTFAAQLVIVMEAIRGAVRAKDGFEPRRYNTPFLYLPVLFICLAIQVSISATVREYVLRPFRIPSVSMSPTILPGDYLLSNQLVFSDRNPGRGDVVIFKSPENEKADFIKRIVGLPGDSLEIKNGALWINGKPEGEPYLNREGNPARAGAAGFGEHFGPLKIPPDSYFVLGDNRNNSVDSRRFGPVPRHRIKGKPLFVYFSRDGIFKWRFGRIGKIIR
jgi:signal peptidase I